MGFWNTGVDPISQKFACTEADPHETGLSGPRTGPTPAIPFAVVSKAPVAVWVADNAATDSRWITRDGSDSTPAAILNMPPGTFDFSLVVNTPASLRSVTGQWASDNDAEIFLNGGPKQHFDSVGARTGTDCC
ncbi:MAG: hypothetical protein ACKO2P_19070 [Planctomycetota bacterium]